MAKKQKILVKCTGSATLPLDYLKPLQGDLKTLNDENYKKLKTAILKHGFSFPFAVWNNPEDGEYYLCDGHMRAAALKRMKEEGHAVPQFPVVVVEAKDEKEAKQKLMTAASQYGKFTDFGVAEFLKDLEWDKEEILSMVDVPFLDQALESPVVLESDDGKEFTEVSAHQREINANPKVEEEKEPPKCVCPQCGHEFNPFEDKKPKVKVRKKNAPLDT